MHSDRIVALLMAAGTSQRFGRRDKRRALLPNGQMLLKNSVFHVSAFFRNWRLVWRPEDSLESFGLPPSTPVLHAPNALGGLGCSVADAVRVISADPSLDAIDATAIFLGDMPAIKFSTLQSVVKQADRTIIVRPSCGGHVGHPVIIGREFWPELAALTGDLGAIRIIRRNLSHYHEVPVADRGVISDVDTREDIARVL
ncbi:NTP transferase domain-containing protein [Microbulbifer sp. ALW1]|uniref:nucleotidyltransferase family protein n=1 Tax=Microbulbifer sp. (strain ALW1) TaxID=1516059 RepID=UPI00135A6A8B|nr:nucleotidyltransferase family protein [Microbulbifer sp. ALW1]